MHGPSALAAAAMLASPAVADTVLGVYMFHRHGDRTAKALGSTSLTDLGYAEVYESGEFYRQRYVANGSASQIAGISPDTVKLAQLSISAPVDNVLMSSALGFSQSLYPAVGMSASTQTLRNGSSVSAPMNGYQLIPIGTVSSGSGSEDASWLQSSTNCGNAIVSSNEYYSSPEYLQLYNSTMSFYNSLAPVDNATIPASQNNFMNAYTIFDLINVAEIHNQTIPASNLLSPEVLSQLQNLAATHEYNLAYNASSPIRAITGATLAAQVVQYLNSTVAKSSGPKLGIQFGAYGSFTSYWGLANMTDVPGAPGSNVTFTGIADYASAMTWELYTTANSTPSYPVNPDDLNVRFYFHNGTTTNASQPALYPLYGSTSTSMSWNDFVTSTNKIAIGDTQQWCMACGNTTGTCEQYTTNNGISGMSGSSSGSSNGGSGNGISKAVAGVIGAMVTLGVIGILTAAMFLLFGLRLVTKHRLAGATSGGVEKVGSGSGSN